MRVQFEFTVDDVVDVQLRALRRSRAARSWRWRDLITTSVLTGAVLFAVIPEGIFGRLVMGGLGLALGGLLYALLNERTVKRRLRKLYEENAGSDNTFLCEVELNESGIHIKQNGMEIIYTWANVKEIQETEDSVDIYTRKGGCVVVRKRAFNGPGEQQQFIELANQYMRLADTGARPNDAAASQAVAPDAR
jgi:YcxB-like protein